MSESAPTQQFKPIPALLGFLFPGLGHLASGNRARGLRAMTGVLVLFVTGTLVGGIDCIDRKEGRWWFVGQAGCGPIAFAASLANDALLKSGSAAPMVDMPSVPGAPDVTASSFKGLAHANEFGSLLVFLAGLLNVCVLLDAGARAPSSDAPRARRRAGDPVGAASGAAADPIRRDRTEGGAA